MIRQAFRIDPRRTGPLDVLLVGISALLAAYSMCASIGSDIDAIFFMSLIVLGMGVSYSVSRYAAKSKTVKWNSAIYALMVVTVPLINLVSTAGGLNSLVPENLFVNYLSVAGGVTWMLALGSFLTWRDNTLLFQAVPSLAIFGLVGCFDTFREATVLFFLFILCLATLMARAHGRLMMKQAEASGHKNVANLNEGPWRWMAGPEWALASATAVVVISIIGAPIVQEEAHSMGISGFARIQAPQVQQMVPSLFTQRAGQVQVGQGPSMLTNTPVLRAQLKGLSYLRSTAYYDYTGNGWKSYEVTRFSKRVPLYEISREAILKPQPASFSVELLRPMRFLPVPGQVVEISGDGLSFVDRDWDGSLETRQTFRNFPRFHGTAVDADSSSLPVSIPQQLHPEIENLTRVDQIPQTVVDLAKQVTRDAHTDYEKAVAIQHEIDRRCKYNLKARATPSGEDPVAYFLFTSHEGYCDLFASSMVAMSRAAGIPARYVVGYLPEPDLKGDYYVATEADAHAWAELFFQDHGWVIFDATNGAQEVEGAKRGDPTVAPWYQRAWFLFGALPIAGLAAIYGALIAFKRTRSLKNLPHRRELGRIYARFERVLQPVAGHPRKLSQTPSEYLDSSRRKLGTLYPKASKLNQDFEQALYGSEEPDDEMIALLKQNVAEFRDETRHARHLVGSGKGKRP